MVVPIRVVTSVLVALLCSFGSLAVMAQLPPRDQPASPPAGKGVIRGRVVRADTGEPLRRVQVRMIEWSSRDGSGPAATMTDADGRYELTQLPAGQYQLRASRGGFVEIAYGQRRPARLTAKLVEIGQQRQHRPVCRPPSLTEPRHLSNVLVLVDLKLASVGSLATDA
jgi:hypothetical protein